MTQARLEALEEALLYLRVEAAGSIVVVEGVNDRAALERLGVGGLPVVVHQGKTLQAFMDALVELAEEVDRHQVVVLVDWDRTGGRLFQRLREGLQARVRLETESRRRLATCCHVRSLEEVPGELAALRRLYPQ
jgi:5S rRNA maturation endonuclease (ribonuclease M5)